MEKELKIYSRKRMFLTALKLKYSWKKLGENETLILSCSLNKETFIYKINDIEVSE